MYWHTIDYRASKHHGDVRGSLVNRGFWLRLPRLTAACRLFGHLPVIDGTAGFNGRPGYRWVCCDRCGIRPQPQGDLDPAVWTPGDPVFLGSPLRGANAQPGAFPASEEGTVGGQLIIGGHVTAGVSVKVGNAGSEHVLAANACIPFLGGLYLHTEGFGTWVQRRLNPEGYESRVTSLDVHTGKLWWRLWALRDHGGGPWWQNGSLPVDPRDILLGERRYSYAVADGPHALMMLMPDGSVHEVLMTLRRQSLGRRRGRSRESWSVDVDCRDGIPYRRDRGGVNGWSVPVSDAAVTGGAWRAAAVAASITKITEMRIRYGYEIAEATL